jgi:tRNA pseudouridine55 synthase
MSERVHRGGQGRPGGNNGQGRPSGRGGRPNRKPKGLVIDGWLIVDKPSGMGSTDVVNKVKRLFNAQKAGHGGTLDPLATGLLPVAFGAATKTVPYVMDGTKTYHFTLRFGEARDTDDADGQVVATSEARPTDEQIQAALPAFRGEIMQVPPAYSAIKIGGERAYDLARDGQAVEIAPRPARVDRFDLIARPDADTAVFHVESGKGVYMRSLARDLARAVGTVGHIAALRRLRVGPFREEHAIPLDRIAATGDIPIPSPDLLLPVTTALADIPALAVTAEEAARLSQGQAINLVDLMGRVPRDADPEGGLLRAMAGGRLLGLCRLEAGWMQPERLIQHGRGEAFADGT